MTTEEEDHEIKMLSKVIGTAVVLFFIVQIAIAGLTLYNVQQLNDANDDTNDILEAVAQPDLVVDWNLRALFTEATVDLDPLPFEGTFVCSELVTQEDLIAFATDLRPVMAGLPALIRVRQNPIAPDIVCNEEPVRFEIPWDQLSGLDSIEDPHEYVLVITAEAPGFNSARAESDSFILRPGG